jgi:nucleotide-binding universal stress UspA family protein
MTPQRNPVVVGVDGSPGSDAAVRWAAGEARRRGSSLRVVHVYRSLLNYGPALSPWPERDEGAALGAAEQLAGQAADLATATVPGLVVTTCAVGGGPVPELLAEADDAAVLVVGSRQLHTLGSFVLGSVGSAVAARASCPVVVVRGPAGSEAAPVSLVVGVDGSESSQPVLAYAFEHATRCGAGIRAVLCWSHDHMHGMVRPARADYAAARVQAETWLSEALAGWREKYPDVPVTAEVADTSAAAGLVEAAAGAHLLIVGTRGRHRLVGAVLGSVSQGVLHHATCPVAVVPTHVR